MPEPAFELTLQPDDEHNRRLRENVHPSNWHNPEPAKRYHLVVIGGGTAGLVSAAGAAGLGARVALVERHLLGGDCLNVGCVPSKGVIRAARAWHEVAHGARFGAPRASGSGDFAAAMERMRRLRADISPHDSAKRFRELGIAVFLGNGRFVGPDAVAVGNALLRFRRAVIATGARATGLPIPGLDEAGYLTNETIFSLTQLPRRLAVIGAGPIGCEMAQSFARFGSQVTILDAGEHVLPREDPDAALIVERSLERDGVRYISSARISSARRNEDGSRTIAYVRDGKECEVDADEILVAVGRAPNVEGLGLEQAGIAYDRSGVAVDDRLRTSNKRVFACGDVASKYKFTHAADAQARIVIQNALFFGRARASRIVMPWCTYTSPEIAHVGMYERDAEAAGIEVDTLTEPLSSTDRAVLDGEDEGFLRIHLKKGTDKILGATLVAAHAGDMIGELALAITAGVGLGKIAQTVHPYPTQGEIVKKAADAWRRTKLTPTVKRIFGAYFRIL
ncbi:MAG: mercuric reductase [Deltaproteobacteria bacterium]|nr:MAG: mercuric reductase [Deltaproteobacteria bacterium]